MAITKRWAGNGIKTPIPNDPQGDNLVNYDEGFTTPYRTPIKDGGEPITLPIFNQLMFDITDEIIQNKGTLNQVAQQVTGLIDDTQKSLTTTWSSEFIDNKLSTAAANIIDDNQITSTLTWSSVKISAEIGQGGGGSAAIDDDTIATDKVWSSYKTNQMVKGGKTISISNFQTKAAREDTEFVNDSANAQIVNLNVKVKTTKGTAQGGDQYLGEVVVYYNSTAQEVLRESVISQNITGAPNDEITSALGSVILDAQDTLLVKGEPATLWDDAEIDGYTANLTTEAPEPEPSGEGLTFTAQASNSSVTFRKIGSPAELQLEYQTQISDVTSEWADYTIGTKIDLQPGDKVVFRNKGSQDITLNNQNYYNFQMEGKIAASSSVDYLYRKDGSTFVLRDYQYYSMFYGCTSLTTAPSLPATTLASHCYYYMFYGCTSLTTAPSLPATTLASYCYVSMFNGCTSLTTAPSLPATTLASHCYYYMFGGCTSLTTAPSLPATTLASYCYYYMFGGCTSLTTAPSLPATTLASYCYVSMFDGCTSLTTAPSLPATTLASYCYAYMFSGCTRLKVREGGSGTKIFTCPSTSGLAGHVNNMFAGTGGSFTGTPTTGNTYNWYN